MKRQPKRWEINEQKCKDTYTNILAWRAEKNNEDVIVTEIFYYHFRLKRKGVILDVYPINKKFFRADFKKWGEWGIIRKLLDNHFN